MCRAPCKFNSMAPWALNAWYHANTTSLKLRHQARTPMKVQKSRHRENMEVGSSLFHTDKKTGNLPKTIKICFTQGIYLQHREMLKFLKRDVHGLWQVGATTLWPLASVAHFVLGGHPSIKILGSENYTRWLVRHKFGGLHPDASTCGQSFMSPLPVSARSSKKF